MRGTRNRGIGSGKRGLLAGAGARSKAPLIAGSVAALLLVAALLGLPYRSMMQTLEGVGATGPLPSAGF